MKPEGAWALLGGYATGTLTNEERRILFEAAMLDQKLFDALAKEDALRQALSDEDYRRALVETLAPRGSSWTRQVMTWWRRPQSFAWAGGLAAITIVAVVVYQVEQPGITRVARLQRYDAPSQANVSLADRAQPTAAAPQKKKGELAPPKRQARPQGIVAELRARGPSAPSSAATSEKDQSQEAGAPAAVRLEQANIPYEKPADLKKEVPATASASKDIAAARRQGVPVYLMAPPSPVIAELKPGEADRIAGVRSRVAAMQNGPLKYSLERRSTEGLYQAVALNTPLAVGDNVRLAVDSAANGHLYVIDKTVQEATQLLFSIVIKSGIRYLIPTQGALPAPTTAGLRNLALLYSPEPLPLTVLGVTGKYDQTTAAFALEIVLNYEQNR